MIPVQLGMFGRGPGALVCVRCGAWHLRGRGRPRREGPVCPDCVKAGRKPAPLSPDPRASGEEIP